MTRRFAIAACLAAGVIGFESDGGRVGSAAAVAVTTVDAPRSTETVASGIDILGRVVGYYVDGVGTHGFLMSNASFTTISVPGAPWTSAYGVNSTGQIVGAYGPGENDRHGFLRADGRFTFLDVPGGSDTVARGINDKGQIVGDYRGGDGARRAFLMSGGQFRALQFPDNPSATVYGINSAGSIVGVLGSGDAAVGFTLSSGAYSVLRFPNRGSTQPRGINDLGDIVGQVDSAQPPAHGFHKIEDAFAMIDLGGIAASWDGRGINNLGQIVGSYVGQDGRTHGYVATPSTLRAGPADPAATPVASGPAEPRPSPSLTAAPERIGSSSPGSPAGTDQPPTLQAAAAMSLRRAADALTRALTSLDSAANQTDHVQAAKASIKVAIDDVTAATTWIGAHPAAASVSGPIVQRPDFTAPPHPDNPLASLMLESALRQLRVAFDRISDAAGGDLGGARTKVQANIAAATTHLIDGMNEAIATIGARRGRARGARGQ